VAGVHTMSRTDAPRARSNPHEIRRKTFSDRFRGFDHGEVRSFLTGLADELEGIQAQVKTLMQENESLRGQLSEVHADPMEQATDQAVSVLNQAQQLADSLIDEAMQSARDLLLTGLSIARRPSQNAPATKTPTFATSSTSGCSPRWRKSNSRLCWMHSTST
jgi:DivIVA domain-containing protein